MRYQSAVVTHCTALATVTTHVSSTSPAINSADGIDVSGSVAHPTRCGERASGMRPPSPPLQLDGWRTPLWFCDGTFKRTVPPAGTWMHWRHRLFRRTERSVENLLRHQPPALSLLPCHMRCASPCAPRKEGTRCTAPPRVGQGTRHPGNTARAACVRRRNRGRSLLNISSSRGVGLGPSDLQDHVQAAIERIRPDWRKKEYRATRHDCMDRRRCHAPAVNKQRSEVPSDALKDE